MTDSTAIIVEEYNYNFERAQRQVYSMFIVLTKIDV